MNNAEMHAADVATFTEQIKGLQKTVDNHERDDRDFRVVVFSELNTVKRLVWIAIGGIGALSWIVGLVGHNLSKYLGS